MSTPRIRLEVPLGLPTCRLGIRLDTTGLIHEIVFLAPDTPLDTIRSASANAFVDAVNIWLGGTDGMPELPFAARGTPFQQRVWHAIREIPRGRTRNYGDIAHKLGSSSRAVGQACGANPFPLFTPCHRVLAKRGGGGFAHATGGWLIDTKLWLLGQEDAW